MGRVRTGWYEREEIQKVTLDWIKVNCKLTEREISLLEIVNARKLVKRDHLEIICEPYRHLGNNRTRLVNRAIKKLFTKMVLDKVHEKQDLGKGNAPCIVALDKGGSLILNIPHKRRISHRISKINDTIYVYRSLPSNYRHINGVNQLEVETILFCEETDNKIVRWDHEYGREFYYGSDKILLIPDVLAELTINNNKFVSYVEYDTGSENHRYSTNFPIIHDKLIKYKKYKSSNLWLDDSNYFPVLLFVTEDHKRIPYFNEKCKELGLQGFGIYSENYTKFLTHITTML